MISFTTAVLQAKRNVEAGLKRRWLELFDTALDRRGIDSSRRDRWKRALSPFLDRHALQPERLRPGQVQAFIREQAESGRYCARALIDLIQALSFFYDCVVEQREFAGEAGHPFDVSAEDWAIAESVIALGSPRALTGEEPRPVGI